MAHRRINDGSKRTTNFTLPSRLNTLLKDQDFFSPEEFAELPDAKQQEVIRLLGERNLFRNKSERLEVANQSLQVLSTADSVTGLPNRRAFNTAADESFAEMERYKTAFADGEVEASDEPKTTFVAIDLQGFKSINDNCCHAKGDEALIKTADFFRQHLRGTDFLARTGGDELGIIMKECDEAHARKILNDLRKEFDREFSGPEFAPQNDPAVGKVRLSFYFGVCQLRTEHPSVEEVINASDVEQLKDKDQRIADGIHPHLKRGHTAEIKGKRGAQDNFRS